MENLLGVVLCGGQSKRMGTDKGLILKADKTWAEIVAAKLSSSGLPVAISVNKPQLEKYQQIFLKTPLIVDNLSIDGPLEGLLTIHKNYPDKDILLMACDLIDMDQLTLKSLIDNYIEQTGFDYYVYQQNGFTQPFCAIYTAAGLSQVYKSFEENKLKKFSLHDRFEGANTLYLPVLNEKSFTNYNQL